MASTVIGVVKQPVASSFVLPSKAQRVTHYQLNKQPSFSLPLPLSIRKHPRKISVSAALKSEGYWIPSSFDSYNLWSIRDDLELPTLAYSGPIAQGGQGPPLMLAE